MNTINVFMDDMRTPFSEEPNDDIPDPYWVVVRTIQDTKTLLSLGVVSDLALDHDMGLTKGAETGYDLLKWMEANDIWPKGSITVHTGNPAGRENMLSVLARRKVLNKCSSCSHNETKP